jgi:hypothetical protein
LSAAALASEPLTLAVICVASPILVPAPGASAVAARFDGRGEPEEVECRKPVVEAPTVAVLMATPPSRITRTAAKVARHLFRLAPVFVTDM